MSRLLIWKQLSRGESHQVEQVVLEQQGGECTCFPQNTPRALGLLQFVQHTLDYLETLVFVLARFSRRFYRELQVRLETIQPYNLNWSSYNRVLLGMKSHSFGVHKLQ